MDKAKAENPVPPRKRTMVILKNKRELAVATAPVTPSTTTMTAAADKVEDRVTATNQHDSPPPALNKPGKRLPRAAAIAAAEATAAAAGVAASKEGRRRALEERAAKRPGGLVREFFRRRKAASAGLQQALQAEREAWNNARGEYVLALSDFETDHSLEITW